MGIKTKEIGYMAIAGVQRDKLTPELLLKEIADYFNLTVERIKSSNRKRHDNTVVARHVYFYLAYKLIYSPYWKLGYSYRSLAEVVNKNHSTMYIAIKTIANDMDQDKQLEKTILKLDKQIKEKYEIF